MLAPFARTGGLAAASPKCASFEIHENHERAIHDFAMLRSRPWTTIRHVPADSLPVHHNRRHDMTWEKPAASDMRFGFEITMYIANR
jgi:pyrroloquinoline quinone biosynthesis protein A